MVKYPVVFSSDDEEDVGWRRWREREERGGAAAVRASLLRGGASSSRRIGRGSLVCGTCGSRACERRGFRVIDEGLLAAKLAELFHRVARALARCPATPDALRADPDALDLVSFNLMLSVQTCADIAGYIIADEGWPAPANLAAGFNELRRVVPVAEAERRCGHCGATRVCMGYLARVRVVRVRPRPCHRRPRRGRRDVPVENARSSNASSRKASIVRMTRLSPCSGDRRSR